MVGKMLVHTSSLASQCYTQGQVNLISVRNYTAHNRRLWGSWISQYPRRHCPRTKVYHLLMNSAASSACCCGQVISLNSRKDQKQHFLSCPLVGTPHAEVTHFTGWEKQRNLMKPGQQAVWITKQLIKHKVVHKPNCHWESVFTCLKTICIFILIQQFSCFLA